MKVILLVGGAATRLKPLTERMPKALIPLAGKPFLEHQIAFFKKHGFSDFILCTGYLAESIVKHFGTGKSLGVNIQYSHETELLGTAGALRNAKGLLQNEDFFIVANGDVLTDFPITDLVQQHVTVTNSKTGIATIALSNVSDATRFGTVVAMNDRVLDFLEKGQSGEGFVSTGIYVFSKKIFDYLTQGFCMFETDVFPTLANESKLYCYTSEESFIDVGTFEGYANAQDLIDKKRFENNPFLKQ